MKMEYNNKNNIDIPVIFYDGETEIDMGKTQIVPSMTSFKSLQFTLSSKIGISPNQITIYIDFHSSSRGRRSRRRPVTSKFDFSAMNSDDDCFFFVVLKRRRRHRSFRNDVVATNYVDARFNDWDYYYYFRYYHHLMMSLNLNSNVYSELCRNFSGDYGVNESNYDGRSEFDGSNSASCSSSNSTVFCEVCCNYSHGGDTVPFHWCKNDVVVTTSFRSPLGPIGPPLKSMLLV